MSSIYPFQELNFYGNCPIQGKFLIDGLYLYFRARGEDATLDVYDLDHIPEELPDDDLLLWEGGFSSWDWPDAGWLSRNDALYVLHMLWADAKEAIA